MRFLADLHIHSHYSRATSPNLNPENLALWAQKKGITVIGTGDFTHPGWIGELREKLVEAENGLYRLRPDLEKMISKELPESCRSQPRFLLSGEISCIYKKDGKTRKCHNLILMPDFDAAIRLNTELDRIGNIGSDGRPILGLDSKILLEMALEASDRAFFIPAHIWTPWFSLFGSKSGFDHIEECFEDLTPHIHALETGLSSDPPMNRLLSDLDDYLLVSNSDAHSPAKLGREANIFDTSPDYDQMIKAMAGGEGFEGTVEFFPEEGKYHMDGHRKCGVRFDPRENIAHDGICPVCEKPLTVGVLNRVCELADRDDPVKKKEFFFQIPLTEILSEIFGCGPATKKVGAVYEALLSDLGPELDILMNMDIEKIERAGGVLLSRAISRMRANEVIRHGGYDGEFGVINLFDDDEKAELAGQKNLFGKGKKGKALSRKSPGAAPSTRKRHRAVSDREVVDDSKKDSLNPEQKEAVHHSGGHLLIVAGPGTGKTMTLSHRIAHIISSVQAAPENVLGLTFTNKAALGMKTRVDSLLAQQYRERVQVMTFHGFCLEVLRNEGEKLDLPEDFNLCSEQDVPLIGKQAAYESGKGPRAGARFLRQLPRLKTASVMGDHLPDEDPDLYLFFQVFQQILREQAMLDLDDLEIETLRLFRTYEDICNKYADRFTWIFVDEYQDTNPVQAAILKALVKVGGSRICAIGDPDQAIYGFRDADVRNFLRFEKDFPGTRKIMLSRNYRSTQTILDSASDVLGKGPPLKGSGAKGDVVRVAHCGTHAEEAEMVVEQVERLLGGTSHFSLDSGRVASHEDGEQISFGDIAVLFRLNNQGEAFADAFSRAGMPFIRSGEQPLNSLYPVNIIWRLLQAVLRPDKSYYKDAYLDLLDGREEGETLLRQCDAGNRVSVLIEQILLTHEFDMSSEQSVEAVTRLKETVNGFDQDLKGFLDKLSLDRGIDHQRLSGDRIAVMSLHAAKGLEWPVVFICGCENGLIPCSLYGDTDEDEERRLLYVGMTRAEKRLILSHADKRKVNNQILKMEPSLFLNSISQGLYSPVERGKWKSKKNIHKQLKLFGD
ncbi:MAG: UvrD-helicase domain-containing protein [Deltaproteobacteria bacterium]|nr:UvrD-helicase domain-containing protein [Deltaproteobacteria bacterium]